MPIIQLDFNNPLNTSVQVGDTAYFSNPSPVPGNMQHVHGVQPPPHDTSGQDEIIKIGEIIAIGDWDGTVSSIQCDMDQALFNKYASQILAKTCVQNFSTGPCQNRRVIPYTDLVGNAQGFIDQQHAGWHAASQFASKPYGDPAQYLNVNPINGTLGVPDTLFWQTNNMTWGINSPGYPAAQDMINENYGGPRLYIYPTINPQSGLRETVELLILSLHYMWDNHQNDVFSNYAFEDWNGDIWHYNYIAYRTQDWQLYYNWYAAGNTTAPFSGISDTYFSSPISIINKFVSEWNTYSTQPGYNFTQLFGYGGNYSAWSQAPVFPISTNANTYPQNVNIIPGCSFDTFWNRAAQHNREAPRRDGVLTQSTFNSSTNARSKCVGGSISCTPGSFIMFSKDNKVNQLDMLGYYAAVEYRNNSTEEAELFNVGATYFGSSK